MSHYKTLRTWSVFLIVLGAVSVVSATIGVVAWAIAVDGFWEVLGVILMGRRGAPAGDMAHRPGPGAARPGRHRRRREPGLDHDPALVSLLRHGEHRSPR